MNELISICVTIKNRSRNMVDGRELRLFPNCVASIVKSAQGRAVEVVVADWHSDDWPLTEWLEEAARPLPVRLVAVSGKFSRGRGRNLAAEAARGRLLMFLDADALLCDDVLRNGLTCIQQGKSYFPVLFAFKDADHIEGQWLHTGFGNCVLRREIFEQAGRWPEYGTWGLEDDHLYDQVSRLTPVVREQVPGFYHQWHPTDIDWKDRYVELPCGQLPSQRLAEEERRRLSQAKEEIERLIPSGARLILATQEQWPHGLVAHRTAIPFMEHGGEYWGAPPDDETAIREVERLWRSGAEFLVVGWPAFWWLQHYREWGRHLRRNFSCLAENDRVVIFRLGAAREGSQATDSNS